MTGKPDHLAAARRARAAGDMNAARRHSAAHLAAAPKDAAGQHFMATLAAEAGRLDIALTHARKAAKLAPRAYSARLDLAKILMLSGKEAAAIRESKAALAIRPNDPAARLEHARILYNSEQLTEAGPHLQFVVDARPDDAEAHAMLAALLLSAQRPTRALASAEAAIRAGENSAAIWELYGRALGDLERQGESLEAFKKALALEPGRLVSLRGVSVSAGKCGDVALARSALVEHIRLHPFEKVGRDEADVKLMVANKLGMNAGFPRHRLDRIYGDSNYIAMFDHPDVQRIHYEADLTDPEIVRSFIDGSEVLFNNIGNAEVIQMLGIEEKLTRAMDATGLPIVNPVGKIISSTRLNNYERLKDDGNILFPKTVQYDVADDPDAVARRMLDELRLPILVRPIQTNLRGGLVLVKDREQLFGPGFFLKDQSYYGIEFHRSQMKAPVTGEEGAIQFRAVVLDGQIHPLRLNWNPGDIAVGRVKREQYDYNGNGLTDLEKKYFAAPEQVIGDSLQKIFQNLIDVVDLDLYGIDFGFTDDDRIIVFEANASMNLHSHLHRYYAPYQRDLADEFDEKLVAYFRKRRNR